MSHRGRATTPSSTTTRPSRSSERTASSSRLGELARRRRRRPAASSRAAAGTSPRTALACARAPRGSRATGSSTASGHAPQRGTRARQTSRRDPSAPEPRADENASPVRRWTRSTFTSTGSTSSPKAKQRTAAAVYGPDAGQLGQVVGPAVVARRPARRGGGSAPRRLYPSPCHSRITSAGEAAASASTRRPALEPGEVARDDALDLRLLQHHLADEDRVRVARAPPREVAPVRREPLEQQLLHACEGTRVIEHGRQA